MSDSPLQELLAAHARGELDEADLLAEAPRPIRAAGADAARAALRLARDEGRLTAPLTERLLALAEQVGVAESQGDQTRIMPGGTRATTPTADADMTRVLPGGTAAFARAREGTGPTGAPAPPRARTTPEVEDDDPTAVSRPREGSATHAPADLAPGAPGDDATAIVKPPGAVTATATEAAAKAAGERELGVGDEIKGRFRLLEPLGQGGMGTIWKAVDKRREEARDRNPYMAIKLLAGDFKNHPEAFIALQRECAKQQRLAHPNIATVYDFDRDGETVFMTMVLLEGQPLDAYIRSLPKGGLPPVEAMPIIEQLAAGLAYAHENGLVHSDLKPGNCYLLEDGNVRLLDFGIARASRTREDAAGETTVFDPGQLGALTPTYATVEMFDGQDPDPRDDIYALGIIAHQLLTGEHPFGKKSAPKAMQLGLSPAPVASLDKRQNRGLRRSLAFLREERTPSVEEFLSELRPRKSRAVPMAVGAVVTLLIIAALAWKPAHEYLRQQENDEIIAVFMHGDEASINTGLARVEALPDAEQRQQIAEDPRTRAAIIGLYVQRAKQHFDPSAGRYDFAAGEEQMELLAGLYPDSAEVLKTRNEYQSSRQRLLAQIDNRLRAALLEGRLLPDAEGEDVADLLDIVHSVDPEHALLHDPGVAVAFVNAASQSSKTGDWQAALRLLEMGESLSPGDAGLAESLVAVRTELSRQRDAARVVALRERWLERLPTLGEETALAAAEPELAELQTLAPWEPLFEPLESRVDPLLEGRVTALLAAGDAAEARALVSRFGPFASVATLLELRTRLGEQAAPPPQESASEALAQWLAREPDEAGQWRGGVTAALKRLLASSAAGSPQAARRHTELAERLQGMAATALEQERFAGAADWLTLGERLAPQQGSAWRAARERLASAQAAASERAAAAEQAARLAQMRERVQALAAAAQAREAREALAAYALEAGAEDGFAAGEGASVVAGAYLAMADAAPGPEEALVLVREGLEAAPAHAGLGERSQALTARVLERALTSSVELTTLRAGAASVAPETRPTPATGSDDGVSTVETVRARLPGYPALGERLAGRVADELVGAASRSSETGDWQAALRLLEMGESLSPGDAGLAESLVAVRTELSRQRDAARVVALRERWLERLPTLGEETALAAAEPELAELQTLAPWEPLFEPLESRVDPLLEGRVTALLAAGDAAEARALVSRFGPFASVATLLELRTRLGEQAAPPPQESASEALAQWLAREPDEAGQWRGGVTAALKRLLASSAAGSPQAARRHTELAERLQGMAATALEQERFAGAADWLTLGERLAPQQGSAWRAARERLASAQAAASERAAAAEQAARLAQMRERVQALAAAAQAREAREALAAYALEAGAEDGFAAGEGASVVAGAYLAMADAAPGPEEALVLVREGLEAAPAHAGLGERSQALTARVLERALTSSVELTTLRAGAASVAPETRPAPATGSDDVAWTAETARARQPGYPALDPASAKLARAVLADYGADSRDPAALEVAMDDFDALYPEAGEAMRAQVGSALLRAIAENTSIGSDGLGGIKRVATDFRALFPDQWSAFSDAVGGTLLRVIAENARTASGRLDGLKRVADDFRALFPEQWPAFSDVVGGAVLRAIADNTSVARDGLDGLKRVAGDFRALFPGQWAAFSDAVGSRVGSDIERLQGEDLPRAHTLLASARAVLEGSPALDRVRLKALPKPSKYAPTGFAQLEAGELGAAQLTYSKMLAEEADHEQFPVFRGALEKRLSEAREYHDAYQQYVRARRKREGQPYLKHALTLWTDNAEWRDEYTRAYETEAERQGACNERLAGYGQRKRGTCYDETEAGARGPVLVVVPAGGTVTKPFAIGKFEVSVGEYNEYCKQSGACRPLDASDASLPVTGIRAADAEAYARWLSEQTGAVYRLPSTQEWRYAADAGGKQPRKDFNCRVSSGGSIIKGHGLVDVQSGQQNGWGLANYIGNAQEWVRDGDRLSAHGGAFEDPLARCEQDLRRDHDGSPDTLTGFRLLRELS